jgi:hypothetical protein
VAIVRRNRSVHVVDVREEEEAQRTPTDSEMELLISCWTAGTREQGRFSGSRRRRARVVQRIRWAVCTSMVEKEGVRRLGKELIKIVSRIALMRCESDYGDQ